jgi:hypothetical protein
VELRRSFSICLGTTTLHVHGQVTFIITITVLTWWNSRYEAYFKTVIVLCNKWKLSPRNIFLLWQNMALGVPYLKNQIHILKWICKVYIDDPLQLMDKTYTQMFSMESNVQDMKQYLFRISLVCLTALYKRIYHIWKQY